MRVSTHQKITHIVFFKKPILKCSYSFLKASAVSYDDMTLVDIKQKITASAKLFLSKIFLCPSFNNNKVEDHFLEASAFPP